MFHGFFAGPRPFFLSGAVWPLVCILAWNL
jgi:ABC-type long-subunit fatty acid transport system fused permease/ATPase subunit